MAMPAWLGDAILYQVYPQSFADSDGDGIGDLRGIAEHLDYLAWLGVTAVWLNPCFASPMRDAGYDVADYFTVDPRYGDNDDLAALADQARVRGIRLLLDLVAGHTADTHPWFVASAHHPGDHRYIWADGGPGNGRPLRSLWSTGTANNRPEWGSDPCYFDADGRGHAGPFLAAYQDALAAIGEPGHIALPTANHDFARLRTGPRTPEQLPAAFAFQLTFPTLPAIYYGEEIGMRYVPGLPDTEGSVMRSGHNRAGSRTPMQWDSTPTRDFPPPRPPASTCRSTRTRNAPPSPGSAPTRTRYCRPSRT